MHFSPRHVRLGVGLAFGVSATLAIGCDSDQIPMRLSKAAPPQPVAQAASTETPRYVRFEFDEHTDVLSVMFEPRATTLTRWELRRVDNTAMLGDCRQQASREVSAAEVATGRITEAGFRRGAIRVCGFGQGDRVEANEVYIGRDSLPYPNSHALPACQLRIDLMMYGDFPSSLMESVSVHLGASERAATCDAPEVGRVPTETFVAAQSAPHPLVVDGNLDLMPRLTVSRPGPTCDGEYWVRVCGRGSAGRVFAGSVERVSLTDFWGLSDGADTPSGPLPMSQLSVNDRLSTYVPGIEGSPSTLPVLDVHRYERAEWRRVVLGDGQVQQLPVRAEIFDPVRGAFRPVASLATGDSLIVGGTQAEVAEVGPGRNSSELIWPVLADRSAFYFNRTVVRSDAGGASGVHFTPAPRVVGEPVSAPLSVRPQLWSYDCQINGTLSVRAMPEGIRRVLFVVAESTVGVGAREPLDCTTAEHHTELRVAPLRRALGAQGTAVEFAIAAGNGERIDCGAPVAIGICLDDGRRITAVESSRTTRAGAPCLAAGTPIDTPNGPVAVETLRPGASVYSFDHRSGAPIIGRVSRIRSRMSTVDRLYMHDGRTLDATGPHLVWSVGEESYVRVSDLSAGTILLERNHGPLRAQRIERNVREVMVYDLSVDGPENYFANGLLVHNY